MSEPFLPLSVRETLRLARLATPAGAWSTNERIDTAEKWIKAGARQLAEINAVLDDFYARKITGSHKALAAIASAMGRQ